MKPSLPTNRTVPPALAAESPLIVHSHLRWDFVWQRPQQLLSRLSESRPVLFVEEPLFLDDVSRAELALTQPLPNLYRAVPRLPASLRPSYDDAVALVRALVSGLVEDGKLAGRFDAPVQWFYTPMPAPAMLGAFGEVGVVYDCMDELAQFRFAPADITYRERYLLARADVVFTGGRKLFEAKSRYHRNVHFFGCGVDADHFARARRPETPLPAELAALGTTVIGYFGVVDERLDYELLRNVAAAFPEATLVMVGPIVKVDPQELPQASNIQWLGHRQYADLPSYVKGFDVCLMPFAINEATEYINPTKTLEYMAAGKPIISTAVSDVVRNFTPVVRVAGSIDEFIEAVGSALAAPNAELLARGIERASASSWEGIVEEMSRLVSAATARRATEAAPDWSSEVSRSGRDTNAATGNEMDDELGDSSGILRVP